MVVTPPAAQPPSRGSPSGEMLLPPAVRRTAIGVLVLFGLLVFGPMFVSAYTGWLWFSEVGFENVWVTVLLSRLALFVSVGLLIGFSLILAMAMAFRARPVIIPSSRTPDPLEPYRTVITQRRRLFGIGVPIGFAVLCGLIGQTSWMTLQLFLHGVAFGTTDPQFGHDVGFYAFQLPFYRFVLNWVFVAVVFAALSSVATHYIFGGIRFYGTDSKRARSRGISGPARRHLMILAGTLVFLKVIAYWLDRYTLVSSTRKEPTFNGAGYTDIHAVLPAKLILLAIAVICVGAFIAAIFLRDLRIPALATALLVLSSVVVGGIWPALMEQFSVRPNAADVERPYIERNISATREAFGIGSDRVDYTDYPGIGTQAPHGVPADVTTIANIRLLDPNVLARTFTQQQQLKNFYGFAPELDIDRYVVDGQLRDYIVGARELSPDSLTGNQTDWINRHTVYTHGNGFVAAPANRVNAPVRDAALDTTSADSGYPIYSVSDLASSGQNQLISVAQPRTYYGEVIGGSDPDYAIVGQNDDSEAREYDTDFSKYTYTGSGGVPIGNMFTRLAFAVKYTERNILFSRAIGPESKILYNRSPRDRVELAAPWLTTDSNPYPAVIDGRILWIVDGYTTLADYPYAAKATLDTPAPGTPARLRNDIAYARNSVKATVDAYDGTVTLYQFDDSDPVLATWMNVFPGTVEREEVISEELRAHFRYPTDLFKAQRELLAKYHVDDPREFFTTNAFWSVPSDPTVDDDVRQDPFYILVGDKNSARPSFRLASAMVGYNREFLSAYISVRSDPDDYGRIEVLRLPTDTLTQGPQQIQNSMISDTRVASERTLLERSNRIQYGNLLTLPIANGGVLYVEPLYTERISSLQDTSTFPQLSRVLVSYRDPSSGGVRVGYGPTLAEALAQVFDSGTGAVATRPGREIPSGGVGSGPARPETGEEEVGEPRTGTSDLTAATELGQALRDLRAAQQSGDFTAYGAALDKLQEVVDEYLESGR